MPRVVASKRRRIRRLPHHLIKRRLRTSQNSGNITDIQRGLGAEISKGTPRDVSSKHRRIQHLPHHARSPSTRDDSYIRKGYSGETSTIKTMSSSSSKLEEGYGIDDRLF
mmetsp:Transcript_22465/g.27532  ORF Transcript_22465/g.27532 Transcript_22465/m.27532 type:complete len:110 (-) Transcript_22465:215-544(-)